MSSIRIPEEVLKTLIVLTQDTTALEEIQQRCKEQKLITKTDQNEQGVLNLMKNEMGLITSLILDWDLPKDLIKPFLQEIRSTPKWHPIPIIMISESMSEDKMREGMEAGIFHYVDKQHISEGLPNVLKKTIKDYNYYLYHVEKVKSSRLSSLAQSGRFRFRTLKEGYEVADWLANICEGTRDDIVVGFIELVVNAIEHGNLHIGYDEKSAMLKEGNYVQALIDRMNLPQYKDKFVTVDFERRENETVFTIKDEGKGFNWEKYLEFDKKRLFDAHGRGIAMSKKLYFDSLKYHGNGNTVEVCLKNQNL